MRVLVVFDFPNISDPDGQEASEVIETLTAQTKEWQAEWGALPPYKNTNGAAVWIETATEE